MYGRKHVKLFDMRFSRRMPALGFSQWQQETRLD